jgi:Metallo-peptidase family M12B Reprolysin-like
VISTNTIAINEYYHRKGATEYCGLGWFGVPSKSYMFSVSRFSCAVGYYSFGHEIGHNFNLNHDKGTEGVCGNAASNYGYRNSAAAFRTILSYDCKVGQCDNMPKDGCSRIQRFSNANSAYLYNGQAIGDAGRDNVKEFNKYRALVASFFPAMNCQSNSECNDGDSNTADTCNTVTRVCVFTPITATPTKAPTSLPIKAPTNAPVSVPVAVSPPIPVSVTPPTNAPTRLPTKAPTRPPTKAPTRPPTKAPTKAPVTPPQTFFMESLKITGVTSSAWTTLALSKVYISPIPVCSVKYDTGTSLLPAIVRVQNVRPTAFDIRLQNPSGATLSGRDVHCVVVEEGAWKMPDGRSIEAKKYSSTVTDNAASWVGQTQSYTNSYTKPVVLGQVMSYNDAKWSVFWSRASSGRTNAPTTTSIITGKQIGEDRTTTRAAETVGFIVIESGHAKSNSIEVETARGSDAIVGYVNKKVTYKFTATFATTPVVAVVCQAAQDSTDGSWAVLSSNPTTTTMVLNVDEDQILDSERSHSTEEVNYAVFAVAGGIPLTKI